MATALRWSTKTTPAELRPMLRALAEGHPLAEGRGEGLPVAFVRSRKKGFCGVRRTGAGAEIAYHTLAQALRGVGTLLAGIDSRAEATPFRSLGIMLDCSRNAVMTVDHLKSWLRRLALLGYGQVMLYTEDTYELPDEPWFGYQRGRYTARELKAVDAYAARLGIEVIPCIQTLGHLAQILRHRAYLDVRDTPNVLMVGEPKTYALIDKMIGHWRQVCRTDRIHIGMDEAEELGRGRYLTLKGYRPGFELMNEHLARVVAICKRHGLKPMIWSDQYFRLGSATHDYYDPVTVIPPEVVKRIPRQVELVYWDYYHHEKDFYLDWIRRHRDMGKEPVMASGIWTWNRYWYDHAKTVATAGPCIDACREAGVREILFTQWGDNGAYCDHDSAFAGMAWCAERAYGHDLPDEVALAARFAAVCGGDYAAHLLASEIHRAEDGFHPDMWDDPLWESRLRTHAGDDPRRMAVVARRLDALARQLAPMAKRPAAAGSLAYAHATARAFADRYALAADLLQAYRRRNATALRAAQRRIPAVRQAVAAMADAFRTMWMSHNKPEGIEHIQGRFGMIDARYQELALRLDEHRRGTVSGIPEWDTPCPPR
jgi:hypothetical protein